MARRAATTPALSSIACRNAGEAWVAGANGTLLYTSDGGVTWQHQTVPTTNDLRAVATQDVGPVFIAGNGVFLTSSDTGAHWAQVSDGKTNFRAVAAAQQAETVLAVSEDGALWSYSNQQLVKLGSFPGARAVAIAADGQDALLVGDNLLARSHDAGHTWTPLASPEQVRYDDVRLDDEGRGVAVGSGGALAHISPTGEAVIQHLGTADLHTVHLAEPDENTDAVGFAAGEAGAVWMSRDGGTTWIQGPNAGRTVLGVDQIGDGHR